MRAQWVALLAMVDHRAASQALVSRTMAILYPDVESSYMKTDIFSVMFPQLTMRNSSDKAPNALG